jgi:hypothetical protein
VATPFFNLQAETGRVTETLQLTGLFNGSVLVEDVLGPQVAGQPCATPGPGAVPSLCTIATGERPARSSDS